MYETKGAELRQNLGRECFPRRSVTLAFTSAPTSLSSLPSPSASFEGERERYLKVRESESERIREEESRREKEE